MSVDAHPLIDKRLQIGPSMSTSPLAPYLVLLFVTVVAFAINGPELKGRVGACATTLGIAGLIYVPISAIVAMETDGSAVNWLFAGGIACGISFFSVRYAVNMKEKTS